jgi:hypothetical protein
LIWIKPGVPLAATLVHAQGATDVSDFCYGRPMLNRIFRQAELMDRVMERVGADIPTASRLDRGMAWYEARSRCIACCHERECRVWLASTNPSTALPQGCPNGEFFRRCSAKRQSNGHSLSISPSIDGGTP